jgi:hypothetical protein
MLDHAALFFQAGRKVRHTHQVTANMPRAVMCCCETWAIPKTMGFNTKK